MAEVFTLEELAFIKRLKEPKRSNAMTDEDMRQWWLSNALSSGQPTKPPVILEIV